MKTEHPILFNAEMVRAVLNGAKTQTRRIVTEIGPNTSWRVGKCGKITSKHPKQGRFGVFVHLNEDTDFPQCDLIPCPYGEPGHTLWVRETWRECEDDALGTCIEYRADLAHMKPDFPTQEDGWRCEQNAIAADCHKWRPSIHMPRWAARILLTVDNIRVERVQKITNDDARHEGIRLALSNPRYITSDRPHIQAFSELWDNIYAARGNGWDVNPWVWVVDFTITPQSAAASAGAAQP